MRIVLCYPARTRHVEQIVRTAPDAEIIDAGQKRVAREILNADIFFGHAKVSMPWDEVMAQGRLRWIQSTAAGLDHCLTPSVVGSDILVTSASGVLADQVAEHAIALITGLMRNMPVFFRAQQSREFVRRTTRDLHGSTVGIVGLGGIGRRLAELLSGFRVRILATDWCPVDRPSHVVSLWPPSQLDDLLRESDVVVLCAPLNKRTRGMIDRRALEKMRPGSFFVNVARGGLVVQDDLLAALESGHLAGAALDVVEPEPLPSESSLWDLPNVIITPHLAGQSGRRADQMTDFLCDNLGRYLSDTPLRNLVDKDLGFPLRTGLPAHNE